MKLTEISKRLQDTLLELGHENWTENQETIFKCSKQGGNHLFFHHMKEELDLIQMALSFSKGYEQFEGSPRVLWITSSVNRANQLFAFGKRLLRKTDTTLELAHDKGKMIEQRNSIFDGCEILITNPRRCMELYNQNGFHVNQLQLVIIDELEDAIKDIQATAAMRRLAESLPKCQKLIFIQKDHIRLQEMAELICGFYIETTLE